MTPKYIDREVIRARDKERLLSQLRRGKWIQVADLGLQELDWILDVKGLCDGLRKRLEGQREDLRMRLREEVTTDPEISDMIVRYSTPAQRQQLRFSCRELSVAVTKTVSAPQTTGELEILIDSCMWRTIIEAKTLPKGSDCLYPKARDAAQAHHERGHRSTSDSLLASFRLYHKRWGSLLFWDTADLRQGLSALRRPLSLSVHSRVELIQWYLTHAGTPPSWIWRYRCRRVQDSIIRDLGWEVLIRNNHLWQSDINNEYLTEAILTRPEVFSVLSQHKDFLRVVARNDWAGAATMYIARHGVTLPLVRAVAQWPAPACKQILLDMTEQVLKVMEVPRRHIPIMSELYLRAVASDSSGTLRAAELRQK
jgi:hypothetical protein